MHAWAHRQRGQQQSIIPQFERGRQVYASLKRLEQISFSPKNNTSDSENQASSADWWHVSLSVFEKPCMSPEADTTTFDSCRWVCPGPASLGAAAVRSVGLLHNSPWGFSHWWGVPGIACELMGLWAGLCSSSCGMMWSTNSLASVLWVA